jgi:uncharacterized protein with HEPN domain
VRNRIAHGYAWIDIETVKATVEEDLPAVEAALRGLFEQLQVADEGGHGHDL